MKSSLLLGTILILLAIVVGSTYLQATPVMMLVDTSQIFQVLRVVFALLLVAMLLYRPPRSLVFRLCLGVCSALLATTVVHHLFNYQIGMIDALLFLEVSVLLAVEGLEGAPTTKVRHIPVTVR